MPLSASDRSALIRLASGMRVGARGRRAILSGLVRSAASVRPYDVMYPASLPYGTDDDGFREWVRSGKTTLQWDGDLPLSDFDDLPAGNVLRYDISDLAESLAEQGQRERVYIYVDDRGRAFLAEGNHRVAALQRLREQGRVPDSYQVSVNLRYRGGSDLNPRAWVPASRRRMTPRPELQIDR